jgi:nucleoid-associated protein YgaU
MVTSLFSRYHGLPLIEVDGRRSVVQRRGRLPVTVDGGAVHVVVGGETLDLLAVRYYGSEELWWRIADANPLRLLFDLAPGDELVIPPLRVATATAPGA